MFDIRLKTVYFLLLKFVMLLLDLSVGGFLVNVPGVVSIIKSELTVLKLNSFISHLIKEIPVMGYNKYALPVVF